MITGTYASCEQFIQDGDLVFIRSKGTLVHRLIEAVTGSVQIHVGLACWVDIHGTRHLIIVDANGGTRRRVLSLSHYRDFDMDIVCAPVEWESIVNEALEHLGEKEYSWLEAVYIGISELFEHFMMIRLPKLDFGNDSEVCSKFIAGLIDLDTIEVSPAKLYKKLQEQGVELRIKIRQE